VIRASVRVVLNGYTPNSFRERVVIDDELEVEITQ
jgi:hypothetical protein